MIKISTLSIVGFFIVFPNTLCGPTCPIKYHGFAGHTACISRSPNYISGGVTDEQKKIIVDRHNMHRAAVKPPACMMLKMYWNDELAFQSQKWAENCQFAHDKGLQRYVPGSYPVGQNLGSGYGNWTTFIDAWHSEVEDFTYNGTANKLTAVGHYTQVVWATSTMLGCGYAKCTNVNLFVCEYGPGGNSGQINRPYDKCDTASPLKDCKGKVCKNGGQFKEDSCECSCKNIPQIYGPTCDINCTVKDRPIPCGSAFKPDMCKFSNVPSDCPWMCNVCPYLTESDITESGSFKYSATYLLIVTALFLVRML